MVYRIFVEKRPGLSPEANNLKNDLKQFLGIKSLEGVRILNRYDVEHITPEVYAAAKGTVFSEPQVDVVYDETFPQPRNLIACWPWRPCPVSLTSGPIPAPSASS